MNFRVKATCLAALLGAVLVLAGCSKSPLSPGEGGTLGRLMPPPVAAISEDGSVSYVWAPVAERAGDPAPEGDHSRQLSASCDIQGERGGTVQAGRFTVILPAGAFDGPATVTLSMPDSTVMICELSITPDTANMFKVPAELVADLSSPEVSDAHDFTMYWYEQDKAHWQNLFAKSRVNGSKVTTTLEHFSKYAAGKAGW